MVVDLLRATTTIATLFEAGLRDLLAVSDIEQAREYARRDGRLLFGEVGGLPPPGFDFGNSPVEAATAPVRGERAVLFTTNGTTALCALAGRGKVIAGALANLGAVASAAAELSDIAIVCAGEDGGRRFALEDFAAAGVIAARSRPVSRAQVSGTGRCSPCVAPRMWTAWRGCRPTAGRRPRWGSSATSPLPSALTPRGQSPRRSSGGLAGSASWTVVWPSAARASAVRGRLRFRRAARVPHSGPLQRQVSCHL